RGTPTAPRRPGRRARASGPARAPRRASARSCGRCRRAPPAPRSRRRRRGPRGTRSRGPARPRRPPPSWASARPRRSVRPRRRGCVRSGRRAWGEGCRLSQIEPTENHRRRPRGWDRPAPRWPVTAATSSLVTLPAVRAIRRFTVRTVLPEALGALDELALNLRWSWHAPTRELFASFDPRRWEAVHGDPVRLLGTLTPERLAALAADGDVVARVQGLAADLKTYLSEPRWYQREAERRAAAGEAELPRSIAYFSAEFGITAALPQYSGGLGILAGDHLKSASDL